MRAASVAVMILLATANMLNGAEGFRDGDPHPCEGWDATCQFINCIDYDSVKGLLVGSEDKGMFVKGSAALGFASMNGIIEADRNALSGLFSSDGTIWSGYGRSGLTVMAMGIPQTYVGLGGPLGEHVWAISESPDGSVVYCGHSHGVSFYSRTSQKWSHISDVGGRLLRNVRCISMAEKGRIFFGTNADGVLTGTFSNGKLRLEWADVFNSKILPSLFINDIGVSGVIITVSTDKGLAMSVNGGGTWKPIYGVDRPKKSRDSNDLEVNPLAENYVTFARMSPGGQLFVGHRVGGLDVFDVTPDGKLKLSRTFKSEVFSYLTTIAFSNDDAFIGTYGAGLYRYSVPIKGRTTLRNPNTARPRQIVEPRHPERDHELTEYGTTKSTGGLGPFVMCIQDDWQTRGDWLGRVGKAYACLAAIRSPDDYSWGILSGSYQIWPRIGRGQTTAKDDKLRSWVHWLETRDERCLELPPIYLETRREIGKNKNNSYRRQAEWDDHGEAYSMNQDGPNVEYTIQLPTGRQILSMYFVNKDGHGGFNRYRDYGLSVYDRLGDPECKKALVRERVVNFWDGVYKRMYVIGPAKLKVVVERNYSFNTILSSVMVDPLDPIPGAYFKCNSVEIAESYRSAIAVVFPQIKGDSQNGFDPLNFFSGLRQKYLIEIAKREPTDCVVGRLAQSIRGYITCDYDNAEKEFGKVGGKSPRLIQSLYSWDRNGEYDGREMDVLERLALNGQRQP